MTDAPRTPSCGCCEVSYIDVRDQLRHAPHDLRARPFEAPRPSRRALLLGTAASLVAGVAGVGAVVAGRPSARVGPVGQSAPAVPVAPAAATAPPQIERAATVGAPARRLRRAGSLMFPMGPSPRCDILDNFGEARSGGRRHEGVDILATEGQEIYAVADGRLVNQADASASLSGNAWGLTADDTGAYYFYAHLSRFADGLELGDRVEFGQVIGYVGDTGNPGPGNYHLHFEVHPGGIRGAAVDPLPLLEVPRACTIN
jgi:murein DD-endopeptidase MepM/ murein hydrolase activator NlpD